MKISLFSVAALPLVDVSQAAKLSFPTGSFENDLEPDYMFDLSQEGADQAFEDYIYSFSQVDNAPIPADYFTQSYAEVNSGLTGMALSEADAEAALSLLNELKA